MNYREWVFNDKSPIYIQLYQKLRCGILSGQMQSGESIPSVRVIASTVHINPNTVMRAFNRLKADALIVSSRGKGYSVTNNIAHILHEKEETTKELLRSYLSEMLALGYTKSEAVEQLQIFCESRFHQE